MEDARIGENLKNILDFVGAFIVISFEVVMLKAIKKENSCLTCSSPSTFLLANRVTYC